MPNTTTLNVRMDADTKREFSKFCDELGMSASSLMNVFARTVVRNQEVPFPLSSKSINEVPQRYRSIFPRSEGELYQMLDASANAPLDGCVSMDNGAGAIKERMGW